MRLPLIILLLLAMVATAYVLVRAVIAMASGKDVTGEQQPNYMRKRALCQPAATVPVVLILLVAGNSTHLVVKLNKIYTRTGDGGSAGLVDGSRVSKASARMTAIGEIDEANAAIGVAIAALGGGETALQLVRIQNELFDLGADVATPGEIEGALRVDPSQVARLEVEIDEMNATLEPLTSFILPSGSAAVSALHLARAVTRRAERASVALHEREP